MFPALSPQRQHTRGPDLTPLTRCQLCKLLTTHGVSTHP
jgi:hypothetical protein